ncbi:GGDEF domain-containing protein [Marinobacter salinexigens]|uniref:diguanylate cyclase n=1 Tax=Marinobacter salinexigens TaxID=2919747 RepID=A0A5B0VEZ6_9GAMM|nr:GGDEF domain-containing protein [Marinobacter salinexigens]KAA1173167.1 GGDEF domain-containing protein [Marinobacter salinexigens]
MRNSIEKTPDTQLSQFRVRGEIPVPVLINWLTIFAVPLLVFFAWRSDSHSHDPNTPAFLLVFAVLLGTNGLIYRIGGSKTLQRRGFITVITLLFTYLATHAVEDGSAILWLFAYPPIVFYISQSRVGVTACAGGLTGVIVLFSPLGDLIFETPYTTSFRLSMIIALAFEMMTCYILDQSRRRSKLGLLRLAADFEHAAKHDALTGLANRREGLEQLEGEQERYSRNKRPFSVLLMDIDLFKQVNDTYGHHVGDKLIILVARILREQCRKVDTIARWGGEEYLVLLPETGEQAATRIANRVRLAIAASAITQEETRIQATISVGVATIHGGESIDRLLQRADEALYAAKKQGRNRVCSYNKTECVA